MLVHFVTTTCIITRHTTVKSLRRTMTVSARVQSASYIYISLVPIVSHNGHVFLYFLCNSSALHARRAFNHIKHHHLLHTPMYLDASCSTDFRFRKVHFWVLFLKFAKDAEALSILWCCQVDDHATYSAFLLSSLVGSPFSFCL